MAARTILVTGGNRGLGFCIIRRLAEHSSSDHILLACRSMQKGLESVKKLRDLGVKSKLDVVELDITNDKSVGAAEREVRSKYGKLDVLVNNAAIFVEETGLADFRETWNANFDVNVTSVAYVLTVFLPLLKETSADPRVVNMSSGLSSISELIWPRQAVAYSCSKAALNMLTADLAKGVPDVKFYLADPGYCNTEMNKNQGPRDPMNGAMPAVTLINSEKDKFPSGFLWRMGDDEDKPQKVPF